MFFVRTNVLVCNLHIRNTIDYTSFEFEVRLTVKRFYNRITRLINNCVISSIRILEAEFQQRHFICIVGEEMINISLCRSFNSRPYSTSSFEIIVRSSNFINQSRHTAFCCRIDIVCHIFSTFSSFHMIQVDSIE